MSPFFGIGKTWAYFQEAGNVPRVYESLNSLFKNRDKFSSIGFENYCWNTFWAFSFGDVNLKKGLAGLSCGIFSGKSDIVNCEGKIDVAGTIYRPGWNWRQR